MPFQSYRGYEVIIINVTEDELDRFDSWLDQFPWGSGIGYTLYPSRRPNCCTMCLNTSFGGTWYREILPELEKFWSNDRIIHQLERV